MRTADALGRLQAVAAARLRGDVDDRSLLGFDPAQTGAVRDLWCAGIMDPVKETGRGVATACRWCNRYRSSACHVHGVCRPHARDTAEIRSDLGLREPPRRP